jgi:purine-nucleoside phosphorylase
MEAAALFTVGRRLGVAVACVLAVSDTFENGQRRRISDQRLREAALCMGTLGTRALGRNRLPVEPA